MKKNPSCMPLRRKKSHNPANTTDTAITELSIEPIDPNDRCHITRHVVATMPTQQRELIDRLPLDSFILRFRACVRSYWTSYGPTRKNGDEYTSDELDQIATKLYVTLEGATCDNGAEAWLATVESNSRNSAKCIMAHNCPFGQVRVSGDLLQTHLLQIFAQSIYSDPYQRYCNQSNATTRCLNIFHFEQDENLENLAQTIRAMVNHQQSVTSNNWRDLAHKINDNLTGTLLSNRTHVCKMLTMMGQKESLAECCLIQCRDADQVWWIRTQLMQFVKQSAKDSTRQLKWICDGNHHDSYMCCNPNHAVSVTNRPSNIRIQNSPRWIEFLKAGLLKVSCGISNKHSRTVKIAEFYAHHLNESPNQQYPIFHCYIENNKPQPNCRIDVRPHNDKCMDLYHKTKSIFVHADMNERINRSHNSFYLTFDSITCERLSDKVYRSVDITFHNTGERNLYIAINDDQSKLINDFTTNGDLPGPIFCMVRRDATHKLTYKSSSYDKYTRICTNQSSFRILSMWDQDVRSNVRLRSIEVPAHLQSSIGHKQLFTIVRHDIPRAKCLTLQLTPSIL